MENKEFDKELLQEKKTQLRYRIDELLEGFYKETGLVPIVQNVKSDIYGEDTFLPAVSIYKFNTL